MNSPNIRNLKAHREVIIKKWEAHGFLDGLDRGTKDNIAMLYESAATSLILNPEDDLHSFNVKVDAARSPQTKLRALKILVTAMKVDILKKHCTRTYFTI
jgi:hypothetical protein